MPQATPEAKMIVSSYNKDRRFLQTSSEFYGRESSEPYSMALVVLVVALFFLLLICILKKSSSNRTPPREVLLEQRRRQRALIRRARLRELGIDPDGATASLQRIQLTAAQAETRRKCLLEIFQSTNVQTVIEEEMLLKDQAQAPEDSVHTTDEEQPQVTVEMVRLPNRKPGQPDLVPNNCAICLESFAAGETVVWSNNEQCQHAFHQDCVLEYLVPLEPEKKSPCPCCRQPFCENPGQGPPE